MTNAPTGTDPLVAEFSEALGHLLGLVIQHDMIGVSMVDRLTAADEVNKRWPEIFKLLEAS